MGKNYGLDIVVFGAPIGFDWGSWGGGDGDDDNLFLTLLGVFVIVVAGVIIYILTK